MIGRLAVITVPELAAGYRLAGATTFEAPTAEVAERLLRDAVDRLPDIAVVAVHEPFLHQVDRRTLRKLEQRIVPVIVGLPPGAAPEAAALRRERLAEMLHRAIGYRITFRPGGER